MPLSPTRVESRRGALRAMHSPAGAAAAGSRLATSSGARRSVARSQRSPVAPPCTRSSTTTQGRHGGRCALPVRLHPLTEVPGGRGMGVGWRAAWGQRAPTPLAGRCAPLEVDWSFTAGLCAAGHRGRARAPSPDRQPWQRGPWRWPAPGSRTRLPIAAALFLPPQDAQCNPGGATSRAGLAALGAPAHP